MVARERRSNRVVSESFGVSTIDYTGASVGSVTVTGLVEGWEFKDLWEDEIWILHCSKYDCDRSISVRGLRPLLSRKGHYDGRQWESRFDAMRGTKVDGTSLTILDHEMRPRKKGGISCLERHFLCECSISRHKRWVTVYDVQSGNTKSLTRKCSMRPDGLLIDPDVDAFIGLNAVYKGVTNRATDGRSVTYYRVTIDGLPQLLHRVAWFVRFGEWPMASQEIHHINHNTADNRIANLELLERKGARNNSQSLHKMKLQGSKPVTSQYKGVSWDKSKSKWVSAITFRNTSVHIGRFTSEEDARDAYDSKASQLNADHGCIFTLNSDLHTINFKR